MNSSIILNKQTNIIFRLWIVTNPPLTGSVRYRSPKEVASVVFPNRYGVFGSKRYYFDGLVFKEAPQRLFEDLLRYPNRHLHRDQSKNCPDSCDRITSKTIHFASKLSRLFSTENKWIFSMPTTIINLRRNTIQARAI